MILQTHLIGEFIYLPFEEGGSANLQYDIPLGFYTVPPEGIGQVPG